MNCNQLRILQVAVVVAVICRCVAQASVELTCSDPRLSDVVRRISKTRFETRSIKSDLVRCLTFVQLIREQQELAGPIPGLARDEPTRLLDAIAEILEVRAGCPGQLVGTLSSLQRFTGDCRKLGGLASGGQTCQGPMVVVAPSECEKSRVHGDDDDDETRKLRDSLAKQLEAAKRMADENANVSRQQQEQRDREASQIVELQLENSKLSQKLNELERLQESLGTRDKRLVEELQGRHHELQELLADQMRTIQELEGHKTNLAMKLNAMMSNEAGHEVKIETLEDTNARLYSELFDLQDQLRIQSETAMPAGPGSYVEIELVRDSNGQLGLFSSGSVYGSVFVNKVMAGSPAARAGLKFGDQLVQVNGHLTAHLQSVGELTKDQSRVKFLVRKSPMEQTFVIKQQPGEPGPGFFLTRSELEIYKIQSGRAAARAGMLTNFRWIAINGESVLGLADTVVMSGAWWPQGEYTVTVMPSDFVDQLTRRMSRSDLSSISIEHNKILADERARA